MKSFPNPLTTDSEPDVAKGLWATTLLGGNWTNSLNTGAFYWNVNNSSSNANRNIGTHLLHGLTLNQVHKPLRPASRQNTTQGTRGCAGRTSSATPRTLGTPHMKAAA